MSITFNIGSKNWKGLIQLKKERSRCYIYTRVSTEMQVEGYSLEAQQEDLEREAKIRGMKVVDVFQDEGRSGKNTSGRPRFQAMMSKIQQGNKDGINYVLVFKLSRFGRNTADVLNNVQIMEDNGVHLYCLKDHIDSSEGTGKLMISILASVAEMERENIQVQTMAGRVQKARDGKWNGGQAPYGYSLSEGILVINEEEAEIIRLIYKKFVDEEWSMNHIAKWLNESGYKKHPRQTGTNERFTTNFVKGILDNPVYSGQIAYGRRVQEKIEGKRNEYRRVRKKDDYPLYEGQHKALIDRDIWDKAQERRRITGKGWDRKHSDTRVHLLSGILVCPECGAKMYGIPCRHNGYKKDGTPYKSTWYYRCNNTIRESGKECTFKTYVRQDKINEQVKLCLRDAMKHLDFEEELKKTIDNIEDSNGPAEQVKRLESAKKKEEARKKKLLHNIMQMDPDDEAYDAMSADYQEILRGYTLNIAEIDENLRRAKVILENAERSKITVQAIQEYFQSIVDDMDSIPQKTLQELFGWVIEKVEIFPKEQPDGSWIKRISFKMPININGTIYTDMIHKGVLIPDDGKLQSEIEKSSGMKLLPNERPDETVVLLSKEK